MARAPGSIPKKHGGRMNDPYMGNYSSRRANRLFARAPDEMDQEDLPSQRKRVPVACNRCRRRKIRCSGDDGKGNPCRGCASSKTNERCRFLRVNAQEFEAPLRNEFGYDLIACRQYQAANMQGVVDSPISPGMMGYPQMMPTDPVSGSLVHRNSASCLYNGRPMYAPNGQWTPPYTDASPVSPSYAAVSTSAPAETYGMGMYQGRQNIQHTGAYTDNAASAYHYNAAAEFNGAQQQALVRKSPSASPGRDAFSFQNVASALQTTGGSNTPQLFRPGQMQMVAPTYTRTPPSTPGSLSPSSSANEMQHEYHGYDTQNAANMYQVQQTTEMAPMPMMQEHYPQAGPPPSIRQTYLQSLNAPRDTSFRQSYGGPPRNSRSPLMPGVIPSQQYMLSGQRMAYMGQDEEDADAEGEEVRYRPSS